MKQSLLEQCAQPARRTAGNPDLAQYSGVKANTTISRFGGLCESDARALQGRQRSPPVLPLPTQQLPPRVCSCIRHCAIGRLGRRLLLQRLGVSIQRRSAFRPTATAISLSGSLHRWWCLVQQQLWVPDQIAVDGCFPSAVIPPLAAEMGSIVHFGHRTI